MLNQFKNISCYEEFEIQSVLSSISKVDILKNIGHKIDNYYFFVSNDGIFNWFDLNGNHIEDPGVLKVIKEEYIPKTITKCIIPNGITIIKYGTFFDCKSLTSVTIPNSVKSISFNVFGYCKSLKEINIPNSVTSIGEYAFIECESLTEITIPDGVTYINTATFFGCHSLKKMTIPYSVASIGADAFYGCMLLKQIIFKERKTLNEVKRMVYYPFGIKDENVFKYS